jgi:FKBP-type peptidyl-prolyl cis-trans isomerase FkpA
MACKKNGGMTPSGYKYDLVTKGSGQAVKPEEYVFFAVTVKGDNGKVLQESKDPDNLPALQMPKDLKDLKQANPIIETLFSSKIGDSIVVYMPIDSLKKGGPIPPDLADAKNVLYIFTVKNTMDQVAYDTFMKEQQVKMEAKFSEVKKRFPEVEAFAKTTLADYKANKLNLTEAPSGIKYILHEEGTGETVKSGQNASVHYYGYLASGESFDNSFSRGQPFNFIIDSGQVIKGWDEALKVLKKGSKATVFIPSALGYGASGSGSIKPNTDLIFYLEVDDVK